MAMTHYSDLASASSNADNRPSESESETEAEALGVRVFVEDEPPSKTEGNHLPPPVGGRPAPVERGSPSRPARTPSPVVTRRLSQSASAIRRSTLSPASAFKMPGRRGTAIFPERFTIAVRLPGLRPPALDLVIDVRRGGEAVILLGALYLAVQHLWRIKLGDSSMVGLSLGQRLL